MIAHWSTTIQNAAHFSRSFIGWMKCNIYMLLIFSPSETYPVHSPRLTFTFFFRRRPVAWSPGVAVFHAHDWRMPIEYNEIGASIPFLPPHTTFSEKPWYEIVDDKGHAHTHSHTPTNTHTHTHMPFINFTYFMSFNNPCVMNEMNENKNFVHFGRKIRWKILMTL